MKNTSRRTKKASRRIRLILLLALIVPTSGMKALHHLCLKLLALQLLD